MCAGTIQNVPDEPLRNFVKRTPLHPAVHLPAHRPAHRLPFVHFFVVLLSSVLLWTACARPPGAERPKQAELGPVPETQFAVGELAQGEPSSPVAVEADDARLGDPDAEVTIVAFLDFECGFCAQGFKTLMTLKREYKDQQLRIVFKHLPLEFHEMALPSAIAGQAVMQSGGSDAFFKYATFAFENQAALNFETLATFAEEAGVVRSDYNELVGQEETIQRIVQDARLAASLGVDGTPAFFVNGRLISGAQPIEYFRQVIGEELAEMKKAPGPWSSRYQARVSENVKGSVLSAILADDPEDYRVPVGESPVLGPREAPVTLVMFTDFECPYCKRAEVTLGLLQKKYKGKVRFVFKHLPLPFHERARPAALLAAAIHEDHGDAAFFRAASAIFRSNPDLSEPTLRRIGRAEGLSDERMDMALSGGDPKLTARLTSDAELADDTLARGTPHFFINGKRLSGARPIEQFEALIDHGLRRANELAASGVEAGAVYEKLQEKALSPGIPQRLDEDVSSEGRPVRGRADAPVTIHVFSDFECPYCKRGELLIGKLEEKYKDQLRIVWHDFPLDFHDDARPAAQAAREAFHQKGSAGFWKMHERLFAFDQKDPALSVENIDAHAAAIGLDEKRVHEAVAGALYDEEIDADIELGQSLGIRGTPAYVVDGYLVTGLKPLRHFERLIDDALEEQSKKTD